MVYKMNEKINNKKEFQNLVRQYATHYTLVTRSMEESIFIFSDELNISHLELCWRLGSEDPGQLPFFTDAIVEHSHQP